MDEFKWWRTESTEGVWELDEKEREEFLSLIKEVAGQNEEKAGIPFHRFSSAKIINFLECIFWGQDIMRIDAILEAAFGESDKDKLNLGYAVYGRKGTFLESLQKKTRFKRIGMQLT